MALDEEPVVRSGENCNNGRNFGFVGDLNHTILNDSNTH